MSASTSAVNSAPITFSGLASGLDTSSIVQKLIAVDQAPITALQNKETSTTNTLKAFSEINGLLTTLQTSAAAMNLTSEVRTTTASVSSSAPFTATSTNAFTGSYNISVSQLAQVQKDITSGFSSNTASVLGSGSVTIAGQVITVNSTNNSLQGLMSAINGLSSSTGVTASIINDGSTATPYHLLLTGQDASTSFTVTSSLLSNGTAVTLGSEASESSGVSSATAALGAGSITIGTEANAPSFTVGLNGISSLQDMMTAINNANLGATASIYNDGGSTNPYHLVITVPDSSSAPAVNTPLTDASGNAISFTMADSAQTIQTAQQANLNIDGLNVVSNSNTVSTAIAGVTLNLNAVSASTASSTGGSPQYATSQLSITPDTSTLETNINTFVTSYNAIINWINAGSAQASSTQGPLNSTPTDPSTVASPTDAQLSQILIGDPTLRSITNQLQSILSGSVNASGSAQGLNNLSAIGITTNEDGTLSVDTTTLENALQNNFIGVGNLLAGNGTTGSQGIMQQFNTYLLNQTSPTQGMYAQKQTASQSIMTQLQDQVTQKSQALNQQQATLTAQFTNMELLISSLNSQSSYMDALYSMAGISSSSSSSNSTSSSSSS